MKLEKLNLSSNFKIQDSALAWLPTLTSLTVVGPYSIRALSVAKLPHLKVLITSHNDFLNVRGQGSKIYCDGSVYDGEWRNDVRWGRGIFHGTDGAIYEGSWENDLFEGDGYFIDATGFYEGKWQAGQKHGPGRMEYTDGRVYVGMWKNGKRHGYGTLTKDGNCYEGQWDSDLRHGAGTVTYADKTQAPFQGHWRNNELVSERPTQQKKPSFHRDNHFSKILATLKSYRMKAITEGNCCRMDCGTERVAHNILMAESMKESGTMDKSMVTVL